MKFIKIYVRYLSEKIRKVVKIMSFMKGVVIGSLITAGTMMMYSDGVDESKKRMMKKGKQIARKMKISM